MTEATHIVEDRTRPIIATATVLKAGTLQDPEGLEGIGTLTSDMLLRGAGEWNRSQLTDEIETLGSTLHVSAGLDATIISGDALTRHFDAFEALVQTILTKPRFEATELAKLKRQVKADLVMVQENDGLLCRRHLSRALFAGHPLARPRGGTEASLARIDVRDIQDFFEATYTRAGALTAAAGDIDDARLRQYAKVTLRELKDPVNAAIHVPPAPHSEGVHVVLVDKPKRSQIPVIMSQTTLNANHPDCLALAIANTVFGGSFTSRLSQEIREKRGWSYGAQSALYVDKHVGTFAMSFSPAVKDTLPAMALAYEMFEEFVDQGVTQDELDVCTQYLIQSHTFDIDTSVKKLRQQLSLYINERPADALDTYTTRLKNLTRVQVNQALKAHLRPDAFRIGMVATAEEVVPLLRKWPTLSSLTQVDYRSD